MIYLCFHQVFIFNLFCYTNNVLINPSLTVNDVLGLLG